jgi:hypothetical protein
MRNKLCIDCGVNPTYQRRRCKECFPVYNRLRVKQYYNKDRKRYGIIPCEICNEPLIKGRPEQTMHGRCKPIHKATSNYNEIARSKDGNMIGRQTILDLGINLFKMVVHHIDENPNNNNINNLCILSRKNHTYLHKYLQKQWELFYKINNNLQEYWESKIVQLNNAWFELSNLKVVKIMDTKELKNTNLDENSIYIFIKLGE